jgi:hypothetical protein
VSARAIAQASGVNNYHKQSSSIIAEAVVGLSATYFSNGKPFSYTAHACYLWGHAKVPLHPCIE